MNMEGSVTMETPRSRARRPYPKLLTTASNIVRMAMVTLLILLLCLFGNSEASAQTVGRSPTRPSCSYTANTGSVYTSLDEIPTAYRGRIIGIAVSHNGAGYWVTTDNGQTFTCNMGSDWGSWTVPGSPGPESPVVSVNAPGGGGLYLATASGAIAAFGGATPHGSIPPATRLNEPIVGMATDPGTGGYWLVVADGGVFSFDAPFFGSLPASDITPTSRIVGIAATPDGNGYRLVGADGGVFDFGNATFDGSAA